MWANAVLLAMAAICVATDWKSRKIYNAVLAPALAAALLIQASAGGWQGIADGVLGFAAGLGILLIPYLMGGMGAGDVKMLAVVGCLKGAAFVLETSIYMAILGAVIALGVLLFRGGIRSRIRYAGFALACLQCRMLPDLRGFAGSATYPYGLAIAGGTAVCLALEGWGLA